MTSRCKPAFILTMIQKYNKQDIRKNGFDPIFNALTEIGRLKTLFRQGWLKRGVPESECESVADHCFLTVITAMLIAERDYPELDILKVLTLSILHEIGEVYVGDITPVDGISEAEKYEAEKAAVERVFATFERGEEYVELWKEFEKGVTPEAKFIKQIDKLEMGMQAYNYAQHGYNRMTEFLDTTKRVVTDERLQKFTKDLK
ncbi:MAG: HD domain-containing protein [Candidatus Cloacimonetes bacterium]|nr:HD domain-containing protein [Candidatus Cloacimonadota bacterium]